MPEHPSDRPHTQYLQGSGLCDTHSEEVQQVASRILLKCGFERDRAAALAFHTVQNGIQYRVGLHQMRASETLKAGFGSCSNKANALVALLRAMRIPAGFGIMRVNGTSYLFWPKPGMQLFNLTIKTATCLFSRNTVHFFVLVYLDGRWLRCDASDDYLLCLGGKHLTHTLEPITFNGKQDCAIKFNPIDVVQEWNMSESPLVFIDHFLSRQPRASSINVTVFNAVLDALRDEGHAKKHLSPSEQIYAIVWGYVLPQISAEPLLRRLPFLCVACTISVLVWAERLWVQSTATMKGLFSEEARC